MDGEQLLKLHRRKQDGCKQACLSSKDQRGRGCLFHVPMFLVTVNNFGDLHFAISPSVCGLFICKTLLSLMQAASQVSLCDRQLSSLPLRISYIKAAPGDLHHAHCQGRLLGRERHSPSQEHLVLLGTLCVCRGGGGEGRGASD